MRSSESGDGCVSNNDLDFEASYARRGVNSFSVPARV
jgi:hypothetical protein